jgi:putative tributyrin esterase
MALVHWNFYSQALGVAASADIILPQDAVEKGGKLPVLYLLHGMSDDHSIWQRRTSIERYADALGLAVVMPAVNRSFYTNMVHGARYWDFVSDELPKLARAFFPLSDKRADNFVAGLSMGGYGAFKMALSHPDRYAAAASLSGAVDMAARAKELPGDDPMRRREIEDTFGPLDKLAGSSNDLLFLLDKLAVRKRRPLLYQWCGTEDFLFADNETFHKHAKKRGVKIDYGKGPGGHTWDKWDEQIEKVLAWLPLKGKK